jgi:hypothetical protein
MKRTYQLDHGFLMGIAAREAGLNRNGCAVYTLARALGEPDEHGEAAEWLPVVVEELRALNAQTDGRKGLDYKGTNKGGMRASIDRLGLRVIDSFKPEPKLKERAYRWERYHEKNCSDVNAMTYTEAYYPTVAQFLRDNPEIERAVIHTRGHAAFIDRKRVYGATARYRVQRAWVLG